MVRVMAAELELISALLMGTQIQPIIGWESQLLQSRGYQLYHEYRAGKLFLLTHLLNRSTQ